MKVRKFVVLAMAAILTIGFNSNIYAQNKSKKALQEENTKLKKTIDSLKRIMEDGEIAIADTTAFNDSINPAGGVDFIDSDVLDSAVPGSNPDSLLSIWYLQKQLAKTNVTPLDLDSANFTTNIPDNVYIDKLERINSFVPIPYNDVVRNYIILYTQKIPRKSAVILGLSSYYMPIFEEIFDFYGLPKELTIMAIIESALNSRAVSKARAKGMWQFMYTTAKQYGLEINSYVDERLDPVKSANAAAKYLKDAYTIFGDWPLAIASYNCGAGSVMKAIRRSGNSKDFWQVYKYLPRETRGYIPSFVGALYLLNYYSDFNIVPDRIALPAHVDTFRIHKNLHFEQISDNIGISVEELRDLNPQYLHDIIPGTEKEYVLNLPYNYTVPFVEKEQEIYAYKDSIFFNPVVYRKYKASTSSNEDNDEVKETVSRPRNVYHKVRRGETLGSISRKYGVTISSIKKLNHMRSNTVQLGKKLLVKRTYSSRSSYESRAASDDTYIPGSRKSSSSSRSGYSTHTIRKGETLFSIAQSNHMTLTELLNLNGLSRHSKIYAGRKIKIRR